MTTILGERLKQARIMQGLSLRGLSDALNGLVSYNALNKYEKGEMMPSSKVLISLADVLNRNPDFFFRPLTVSFSGLEFRKCKSKLSKTDENRIREESRDFFERYLQIEEIIDKHTSFHNPLSNFTASSPEDAEKAAQILRQEWKLGLAPLPNLYDLLEEKGIVIKETSAPKAFDGLSAKANALRVIVIAKHLDQNLARKRLTIIHELGHLLLQISNKLPAKDKETLMNRFAGAFLIPKTVLIERLGKTRQRVSVQEYRDLKMIYGVSISALVMRADQLNIVPKTYTKNFWLLRKKWGWDKNGEPGDIEYNNKNGEHSHRFPRMVHHALAEGIITTSKAAALLDCSVYKLQQELDI